MLSKLQEKVSLVVENKRDEDIINQLYFLKQSIEEMNKVIDSDFSITFVQLQKSANKMTIEGDCVDSLMTSMADTTKAMEEDDIIMSMMSMARVLSSLENTLDGTSFDMSLIYNTKAKPSTIVEDMEDLLEPVEEVVKTEVEEKVEPKVEEKVKPKKTVEKKKVESKKVVEKKPTTKKTTPTDESKDELEF